jgi:hypothetical protein
MGSGVRARAGNHEHEWPRCCSGSERMRAIAMALVCAGLAIGGCGRRTLRQAEPQLQGPNQAPAHRAVETQSGALRDELTQAWQGAWVVRDADYPGSVQAWMVRGSEVTVYDAGRRDAVEETFVIVSPCRVERTRPLDQGSQSIVTADTFAFASDGLHIALPPAAGGMAESGAAWVCVDDSVYTVDGPLSACRRWASSLTVELTRSAECEIGGADDRGSFVIRPSSGGSTTRLGAEHTVLLSGDRTALLSVELQAGQAQRMRTFDEARRSADAITAREPWCGAKADRPECRS